MAAVANRLPAWITQAAPDAQPPALAAMRAAARRQLESTGLPTRRDEDWRYTRLAAIEGGAYVPLRHAPQLPAGSLPKSAAVRLVLSGGHWLRAASSISALPEGLRIRGLEELLTSAQTNAAGVDACIAARPFVALNGAFLRDAVVIDVAPGAHLTAPLEIQHLALPHEEPVLGCPRVLLRLGAGARVHLVERYSALPDAAPYLLAGVLEITLGAEAHCEHVRVLTHGRAGTHIGNVLVRAARAARYDSWWLGAGGALVREDLDVCLDEPGAHAELHGLYTALGSEHVDCHTRIEHRAPDCTSRERYQGVLSGKGKGVFNGRVHVHPGADGTDAQLQNANLLLSAQAAINTKPELEIYAEDVRCAHGATVGQIDPQQLYYLRSRGIPEAGARAYLTEAFCRRVYAGLEQRANTPWLEGLLVARLAEITASGQP